MEVVDEVPDSEIDQAFTPADSARMIKENDKFHLDRQVTRPNAKSVKVAVQKNHGDKGTVGQVEVFPDIRLKAYEEILAKPAATPTPRQSARQQKAKEGLAQIQAIQAKKVCPGTFY
jgi:hypothetical protein